MSSRRPDGGRGPHRGPTGGSGAPRASAVRQHRSHEGAARRRGRAVRLGRHRRRPELPAQGRAPRRRPRVQHRDQFGAGDGEALNVAANVGLPLGATGFANLSLEYGGSNPTDHSAPRNDAIALLAAGNTDVASDTPQVWGSPRVEDDLKRFGNFGYTAANGVQLYSHTNYASKTVTEGFFFRNPNTRGGVYSLDGGSTLLVGDALLAAGAGAADCPVVTITGNVADPAALRQVFDDANCFSFRELLPGGFTPNVGGEARDMSLVGGVRGFTGDGLVWVRRREVQRVHAVGLQRRLLLRAARVRLGRPEVCAVDTVPPPGSELAVVAGSSCDGVSGRRVGGGAAAVGGGAANVPAAGTAWNRRRGGAPFGCAICRVPAAAAVAGGELGGGACVLAVDREQHEPGRMRPSLVARGGGR